MLHGFPSSSRDFSAALPTLAARRKVVVHDHLGFGLSDKPADYSYSLLEQAEVALGLWRSLGITRGHLVAHDYGTSVATEILARRERGLCPIEISSVTLCNGSVHIDLAHLTPSQRLLRRPHLGPLFARLANRRVFLAQLRRILGDPASVPESELLAMWEGLARDGGRERLPALSGYMNERVRFRARWIDPLTRLDLRCHVLWGRRDPVAVPAIAEQLAREIPGAALTWLDELGHYPMLEAPARWASAVLAFLETPGKRPIDASQQTAKPDHIVTSPTPFREERCLRDGTRVTLRLIQADDAGELRRAFSRLSARSRYQRFLGGVPELTDEMVAYLTRVDGEDHVAIVAGTDSLDLKTEVGLGVARFVRLKDEPDVAEAAITVVDDAQGKGVGRLLLTALATLAVARGIRVFRGEVLAENARMRHLLDEVGAATRMADGQTLVFDVPIQPPLEDLALEKEPPHLLRRLLRAAAESLGMVPHQAPPPPLATPAGEG